MKRFLPTLLLIVSGALFLFGIIQLMEFRFELGDVYPAYSSLRSDPQGTMALYESLARVDGLRVERDFSTANRLPAGKDTTYLHLATSVDEWELVSDKMFSEVERFVAEGGRLLITMRPQAIRPRATPQPFPAEKDPEEEKEKAKQPSLWKRWNLKPEVIDLKTGVDGVYRPVTATNNSIAALPPFVDWHSGIVFKDLDPAWKAIYSRNEFPVVIERSIGRGSVVIATDSYLLSNEAMLGDRHADLLAWFVGPNHNLLFDEAHLGVAENAGVATLMRRYHLQWFVAALVLLSTLFIWKNAVSLVPPRANTTDENYIRGRDSFAGFVNLLRRSIPASKILATSYAEWKKTGPQTARYSTARLNRAQEAFDEETTRTRDRNAVRAYRTIAQILHKNT
jgi:hypothetical protein